MCHGKILRSPYAHARIKKIDISRAAKIPGVVAVLTRDDILHDQGIEPYYGPGFQRPNHRRATKSQGAWEIR